MLTDKQKRIIQLAFILAGFILGNLFPSSLLNNSKEGTGLLGGFLGFLISIALFPETIQELFVEQKETRVNRLLFERKLGFYRSLTHPTQIPLTLSMILFIFMILLLVLLDFLKIRISPTILQAGLFLIAFLWGLSGLLIITRREYIDKTGRRYKGFWAMVNGIAFLLFGWGSLFFLLLAKIFNW